MEITTKILCKNYTHKRKIHKKLIVNEQSTEYYVLPLNNNINIETDGEDFMITAKNNLLWLKRSNKDYGIILNEYDFDEFLIIYPDDVVDINVNVHATRCLRKNVWSARNKVYFNKQYIGDFYLVIPILDEDFVSVRGFGEGIVNYEIDLITNEILLKQVFDNEGKGYVIVSANVQLCKEALFVPVSGSDLGLFL